MRFCRPTALSRLGLESVTEVLRRILVPPAPAAA